MYKRQRFDRKQEVDLIDIAVIRVPRISNFTDFNPLESIPGVSLRYVPVSYTHLDVYKRQAPTHAFIGGSSGNLKEIVKLLLEKNPQVRIVINCITLETVSEALETAKEFGFEENEIVQLSAARSKAIGRYHMMMGENPIYIITLQNPGK